MFGKVIIGDFLLVPTLCVGTYFTDAPVSMNDTGHQGVIINVPTPERWNEKKLYTGKFRF